MPLQRFKVNSSQEIDALSTNLRAEGIHLAAGRTLLNREAELSSALLLVRGEIRIGTIDDNTVLLSGEGALIPAGTKYFLDANKECVAIIFALPSKATG
jgi:hypothetical protein